MMDIDNFYKIVQKYMSEVPLLLIGTGGTIPYGIPGMNKLAEHLIKTLDKKYELDSNWNKLVEKLQSDVDLENALTDLSLNPKIIEDIAIQTWKLITKHDLRLLNELIYDSKILPIGKLLKTLCRTSSNGINIVTTNYDRVIEYACDQCNLSSFSGFAGNYIKQLRINNYTTTGQVNILKVHGSLDWFKDINDSVCSIPIQSNIPKSFTPAIIPPGPKKYEEVFDEPFGSILHEAGEYINKAKSFLCIGYGFNDKQIQNKLIPGIKQGKPIIIVTQKIRDEVCCFLINNSDKYVIIQEDSENVENSDIMINKKRQSIKGKYWQVDEFNKILDD